MLFSYVDLKSLFLNRLASNIYFKIKMNYKFGNLCISKTLSSKRIRLSNFGKTYFIWLHMYFLYFIWSHMYFLCSEAVYIWKTIFHSSLSLKLSQKRFIFVQGIFSYHLSVRKTLQIIFFLHSGSIIIFIFF